MQNTLHVVYKLTFPNGKVYIGETVRFNRRMLEHNKDAHNPNRNKVNTPFKNAIRKYGWENVQKEILVEGIPYELIRQVETFWIRYYKFYLKKKVYNLKDVSEANRHSKKSKLKMSRNNAKYWQGKSGSLNHTSKAVLQFDLQGNFIQEWGSGCEASKALKINQTKISAVCLNNQVAVGGFFWFFKKNFIKLKLKAKIKQLSLPHFNSIAVYQISKTSNKILKKWTSTMEIERTLNIPHGIISAVCKGTRKTAKGFIWKYA